MHNKAQHGHAPASQCLSNSLWRSVDILCTQPGLCRLQIEGLFKWRHSFLVLHSPVREGLCHTHTHTHTHTHRHIYVTSGHALHVKLLHGYRHMHACICVCVCPRVFVCLCLFVFVCVHFSVCVCVCALVVYVLEDAGPDGFYTGIRPSACSHS